MNSQDDLQPRHPMNRRAFVSMVAAGRREALAPTKRVVDNRDTIRHARTLFGAATIAAAAVPAGNAMMKSASLFEYPVACTIWGRHSKRPRPASRNLGVDDVTLSDNPRLVLPFACGEGHPMPHPAKPATTKNPVAVAVGLPDAPVLTTRAARGTGMAFLELNCERRNAGITQAVREDAFLIALQMKTCPDFDLYADGRLILPKGFDADDIAIFDLRTSLATDLRDPFHAVDFYLPHKALAAMGDDGDIPRHIQELRHTLGTTVRDPVARDLLLVMRPALAARPEETPELFVDHVALALSIHVARRYGDVAALPKQWGGGLAPWQERRAKEFLDAHIGGGITLNVLARACELSNRHFTRAFRQSTGMAPHQWLQYRRMEKAKHLLDKSSASLSSIATDCGFADQSHFTRTFSRVVGVPPGTWRRTKRE